MTDRHEARIPVIADAIRKLLEFGLTRGSAKQVRGVLLDCLADQKLYIGPICALVESGLLPRLVEAGTPAGRPIAEVAHIAASKLHDEHGYDVAISRVVVVGVLEALSKKPEAQDFLMTTAKPVVTSPPKFRTVPKPALLHSNIVGPSGAVQSGGVKPNSPRRWLWLWGGVVIVIIVVIISQNSTPPDPENGNNETATSGVQTAPAKSASGVNNVIAQKSAQTEPAPNSPPSASSAINPLTGPSFPCPQPLDPLAELVCSTPSLALLDMQFVQTYNALLQQVGTSGEAAIRESDINFDINIRNNCGIAQSEADTPTQSPPPSAPAGSDACVIPQYQRQIAEWQGMLQGAAAEEAARPIQGQMALQAQLQKLGFLPSQAAIDGIFGPKTRAAITQWQISVGHTPTGLLGDADAQSLASTPISSSQALGPNQAASQSQFTESQTIASQPPLSPALTSYAEGHADRVRLENYANSLQGSEQQGFVFWSAQRSLASPESCEEGAIAAFPNDSENQATFVHGCQEGQFQLTPTDIRRQTDPMYKAGWNAPVSTPAQQN